MAQPDSESAVKSLGDLHDEARRELYETSIALARGARVVLDRDSQAVHDAKVSAEMTTAATAAFKVAEQHPFDGLAEALLPALYSLIEKAEEAIAKETIPGPTGQPQDPAA